MTTNHITPTIGRIVYYRGRDNLIRPAMVTAVHSPFSVNLYVFPSSGSDLHPCGSHDVVTHADPEQEPGCLNSWHWMPYQLQQAAKDSPIKFGGQLSAAYGTLGGENIQQEDQRELRRQCLEMALRTSDCGFHENVIAAAKAYQDHIEGKNEAEKPLVAPVLHQLTSGTVELDALGGDKSDWK